MKIYKTWKPLDHKEVTLAIITLLAVTCAFSASSVKTLASSSTTITDLSAADNPGDQGGAIKLKWSVPTPDNVDGYKIQRKCQNQNTFQEIGSVLTGVSEYLDTVAPISTNCSYQVFGYKNPTTYTGSSIVNATSVDNLTPSNPSNFHKVSENDALVAFTWDRNREEDIDGYVVTAVRVDPETGKDRNYPFNLEKNVIGYTISQAEFPHFASDNCHYYIQARDTSGNLSEKVEATTSTQSEKVPQTTKSSNNNLLIITIALAILSVTTSAFSITQRRMHMQSNSKSS